MLVDQIPFPDSLEVQIDFVEVQPEVTLRCLTFRPKDKPVKGQILFVSGWISELSNWRYFLPVLAKEMEVIYLETREKRTSKINNHSSFSIESIRDDVVAFIDKQKILKPDYFLIGSSMGATLVIEILQEVQLQPHRVVLIMPNSKFDIPKSIFLLQVLPMPFFRLIKQIIKWFVLRFRVNPNDKDHQEVFIDQLERANMYKLKKSALAFRKYQLNWKILKKIFQPTLVIGAQKDNLHKQAGIRKIANEIKDVTIYEFENFTNTHSSRSAQKIKDFINS